jgi:hypothetical protein
MGMTCMVDDGCNCFMMMDGGYEITDSKLKWSDNILMSAIVVMMNDNDNIRKKECVYLCMSKELCVWTSELGC